MGNLKLDKLRNLMKERNIDTYFIPISDYHSSEYIGDYFKNLKFLTGFTGSAATAVVTHSHAAMWTDGRYFIQAEKELADTEFDLMKIGEENVPSVNEFILENTPASGIVGFDGKVVTTEVAQGMKNNLSKKQLNFSIQEDLISMVWNDRPHISSEPVWILTDEYAGVSLREKLIWLKSVMKEKNATTHILTTLDETAWLFNLRGNDIANSPLFLSYAIITQSENLLFVQDKSLSNEILKYLSDNDVKVKNYNEIFTCVAGLKDESILLESQKVNFALYEQIDLSNNIIDEINPVALKKAIKNPVEISNIKKSHIKDGVAVTKFMYWLKQNIGKLPMDELSVAQKLEDFRKEQDGFIEPSFSTIAGYRENAAMCHYRATAESFKKIEAKNMLLVDSGAHYLGGTTDITRTFILGETSEREKEFFTLTSCSMLKSNDIKFPYGCTGLTIDYAIRESIWKRGLNYNHGTGHGVGYMTGVHERPNNINWKLNNASKPVFWEEGMIVSVEPGIYIEGELGVRMENIVVCIEKESTEFGKFLGFENMTYAPIDLDGIDKKYMSAKDISELNSYHKEVYAKLSPFLNDEEASWLKEATREI